MENDDLKNKLDAVLSNPEMMQKVMGIVKSMRPESDISDSDRHTDNEKPKSEVPQNNPSGISPTADSAVIAAGLQKLLGGSGSRPADKKSDDPKIALLMALRPYLNPQRQERIDKILKMLSMSEIAALIKNIL